MKKVAMVDAGRRSCLVEGIFRIFGAASREVISTQIYSILKLSTRCFAISFEWRKGKASRLLIYDCFGEDFEEAAWLKDQNSSMLTAD